MKTDKLTHLKDYIAGFPQVAVAFSGGVDSTLLLKVCEDTLGKDRVVACTGISPTLPQAELEFAREFTRKHGITHVLLPTDEFNNREYLANPPTRCYLCKTALFRAITAYAKTRGIQTLFDGSNDDDLSDYRPGLQACKENMVKSPLAAAGITKDEIRSYSRELGLADWDRPAGPCLASRIPYGQEITTEKLRQIEKAENLLKGLGFITVRVRHHGGLARIEVPENEITRLTKDDTRKKIFRYIKDLGFSWVCIDLAGFQSGNLNRDIRRTAW
jgi:uncharacterized protein